MLSLHTSAARAGVDEMWTCRELKYVDDETTSQMITQIALAAPHRLGSGSSRSVVSKPGMSSCPRFARTSFITSRLLGNMPERLFWSCPPILALCELVRMNSHDPYTLGRMKLESGVGPSPIHEKIP